MTRSLLTWAALACFAFTPSLAHGQLGAQLLADDLDDNSAGWLENSLGFDFESEFGYDYSEYGIPAAPNGSDTLGLRVAANIDDNAGAEAVQFEIFDSAFTGQYTVQVDMWINHPFGSDFSTEFIGAGVGSDGFNPLTGASLVFSGDGGSSRDYRLYKDAGEQFPASAQYALGTDPGVNDNFNPALEAAFPSVTGINQASLLGGDANVGDSLAGTGGFQWMTMTIEVDTEGIGSGETEGRAGIATFTLQSAASGAIVEIGTVDSTNVGSDVNFDGAVSLIYREIFSSISDVPEFQFGIFDNVFVWEGIAEDALEGDFDGDGDVDNDDLNNNWALNYGLASGASVAQGDADGDGDVDGADLLIWQSNYTGPGGGSLVGGNVPEPSSLALALLAAAAVFGLVRRR